MDEESLKRNTDCVYFLASPFTCKKGVECEYRHSEIARLNPIDCRYWLSGKCLNPTCGFRHPPVDMHTKAPAKAEPLPDKSSFVLSKSNVPCYFYLNRHCNKGNNCIFLHGPKDTLASKQKDFAVVDAPSVGDRMAPDSFNQNVPAELSNYKLPTKILKAKLPARTDPVRDQPVETAKLPAVLKRSVKTAKEDPLPREKHAEMLNNVGRTDPSHSFAYEYKEASATMSDSLNSSSKLIKSYPSISSDQYSISKEKVDNGVQGEGWESSPGSGFDDLVEGRSESIEDTDDEDDMLSYGDSYDRNDESCENLFKDHSYEDQKGYGGRFLRERRIHGPVFYSDDEDNFDLVGYSDWDRGGNHILSQKRKLINVGGHYDVDLRDHLAKRRSLDGRLERPAERFSFRRCSLPLQSKERRGSPQRLHGRFASRLKRNHLILPLEKSTFSVPKQRHEAWSSQPNSRRHLRNQKRQKLSRRKRDSEVRTAFSFDGPMTLSQIREAKCSPKADSTRHSSHSISVNFAGPKPLTEILKDKKKFKSDCTDCNTNG